MAEIIVREAIAQGLREALEQDESVFLLGEDIGEYDGAYAVTRGFLKDFGPERIRDTPISESGFVGAAVGAALVGLRPIVEIMTINFSMLAMDQIINHAAKFHYMSDGQLTVPMVIRTVTGGGAQLAATHSQSLEGWYASVPGLKVAVPSTPYDALGLLRTSIKDDNPIIFAEHALLYGSRGEVPSEYYEVPFGQAAVRREGADVTIVGYSRMAQIALEAADMLAERGRHAEVIDLRTLRPFDIDTIVSRSRRPTARSLSKRRGVQAVSPARSRARCRRPLSTTWTVRWSASADSTFPRRTPGRSRPRPSRTQVAWSVRSPETSRFEQRSSPTTDS